MENIEEIKKLVSEITNFVNSYSIKSDEFIEAMSREHRTLQQSFTRLCLKWIEYCASDEYKYDARNQASHEIAGMLIELWQYEKNIAQYSPPHYGGPSNYLPFI